MKYETIIGVLTYSQGHFLKSCLSSIANTVTDFEKNVIVVANNSEDENYIAEVEQVVRAFHTNITTINFRRNRGTSAAWNAIARSYEATNIAILNDDVVVFPGWMRALELYMNIALLKHPFGLLGLHLRHGKELWETRNTSSHEEALLNLTFQETTYPAGSLLFFQQAIFNSLGGFDEHFWCGLEEVDFAIRVARQGYRNGYVHVRDSSYFFGNHYGSGTGYEYQQPAKELINIHSPQFDYFEKKHGVPFPLPPAFEKDLRKYQTYEQQG